jgi:hypothetical protein
MRLALLAAAGVLAAAAPAMANEARLEIHSGVIWNHDSNDATIGAAAGYDYDLNKLAFVGAEVSADKILAGVYNRVDFGFTGRAGVKINNSKLYGLAGYSTTPAAAAAAAGSSAAAFSRTCSRTSTARSNIATTSATKRSRLTV